MRSLTIYCVKHTINFWYGSTLSLSSLSFKSRMLLRPFVILAFLSMGKCVDVSMSVDSPVSTL